MKVAADDADALSIGAVTNFIQKFMTDATQR